MQEMLPYPLLDKHRKCEEMSHFGKRNIGNLIFGPVIYVSLVSRSMYSIHIIGDYHYHFPIITAHFSFVTTHLGSDTPIF